MEPISDLSWLRQLSFSSVERFELRGFGIAVVSMPPTPSRHEERFRYRLLAFDPGLGKPVLSIDLESDILGDFCLSSNAGASIASSRATIPRPAWPNSVPGPSPRPSRSCPLPRPPRRREDRRASDAAREPILEHDPITLALDRLLSRGAPLPGPRPKLRGAAQVPARILRRHAGGLLLERRRCQDPFRLHRPARRDGIRHHRLRERPLRRRGDPRRAKPRQARLGGNTTPYTYEGRTAILAELGFPLDGVKQKGYALFIEGRPEAGTLPSSGTKAGEDSYALLAYAPEAEFDAYSDFILSCLDSFSVDAAARRSPGPLSQFTLDWPPTRDKEKTVVLVGGAPGYACPGPTTRPPRRRRPTRGSTRY